MAKFDIKGIGKSAMETGKVLLPVTAGVIGAQKFLDAKTFFKDKDPNLWYIKHEGALKFGGVVITLAMWKKCPPMVKYLLYGVAIQGLIKEVRVLTTDTAGKTFVDQIGAGEYDAAITQMAQDIQNAANMNGVDPITQNIYSSVAGIGMIDPTVSLINNAQTGVSGMGMGLTDLDEMYN